MEQKLITLLGHLNSHPVLVGFVFSSIDSFLCTVFLAFAYPFVHFVLDHCIVNPSSIYGF